MTDSINVAQKIIEYAFFMFVTLNEVVHSVMILRRNSEETSKTEKNFID